MQQPFKMMNLFWNSRYRISPCSTTGLIRNSHLFQTKSIAEISDRFFSLLHNDHAVYSGGDISRTALAGVIVNPSISQRNC